MPSTIETLLHSLTQQLLPAYDDQQIAQQNAWFLLEHVTQKTRTQLITHPEFILTPEQLTQLQTYVHDIVHNNKPIQYILGTVPFLNLTLKVRPPILIPRPETEQWCSTLIEQIKNSHKTNVTILDLCTGSGCIALTLAKAFPTSTVYATDINPQTLELARENAQFNKINNIIFIESDLYQNIPHLQCDVIVANPPYITEDEYTKLDPSVAQWEDKQALVAPDHGLTIITQIIAQAQRFLRKNTSQVPQLWIEIGYQQGPAVSEIFKNYHVEPQILRDFAGHDRVVIGTFKKS